MHEQIYQRTNIAKEQLEVAIELFLARRSFVSALTLAGAAEEILGKALTQRGKETTLEHEHSVVAPFTELIRKQPYSRKDFVAEKNRVRNAAKHLEVEGKATFCADLEDEALWMIVRAIDNYRRLGCEPTALMEEFDNWFYANVVGLAS